MWFRGAPAVFTPTPQTSKARAKKNLKYAARDAKRVVPPVERKPRIVYPEPMAPEIRQLLDAIVQAYVDKFQKWMEYRMCGPVVCGYPFGFIARQFKVWWRTLGPVQFTNFEDSRLFKTELLVAIRTRLEGTDGRGAAT